MWHPDVYFANARIAEFHTVGYHIETTVSNRTHRYPTVPYMTIIYDTCDAKILYPQVTVSQSIQVTQPNFLVWIESDGSILYDTRISLVVLCTLNLEKWPLDSQRCNLRILSCTFWSLIFPCRAGKFRWSPSIMAFPVGQFLIPCMFTVFHARLQCPILP